MRDTALMDCAATRSLFPLTKQFIYMNHAGASPMSERARAAIEAVMEQLSTRPYPGGLAGEEADRLRKSIARLVGAEPETIGLVRGTAHGISLLAQGLDWRDGDNVVGARGEYPANVYPWMALRDRGVEFRMAEPLNGRIKPDAVLSLVDDRTRVVALSHVEFWNGYRVDLQTIGCELDRRGVLFAVDAIQSVGALRVDLSTLPVDFLAAGAQKWLLGPQGIGFCYCRPELLHRLRPVLVGTGTVKQCNEYFAYDFDLGETARRFEESSISLLDMAAFQAAVDLMLEVGPKVIEEQVLELSRELAEGLCERGYEVVEPWPRRPEESSGIVSFRRPGSTAHEVLRDLNAARVVGRVHADFVRLSPHFYNTPDEVRRVLDVLAPPGAAR
ncbi:MAG TPA: aminotransferase class V-fold PLP-dependent enzyme [Candidatus Dormibacteraeota bacterium]|nr:aminotransferase class V-fold PLP-dependent enzyme [Candidatus Dormibacteraeota bacterium]